MKDEGVSRKRLKRAYMTCLKYQALVCALCGEYIEREDDFSFDHVIPRSKGGPEGIGNLVPAHKLCNQRKVSMTIVEFRDGRSFGQ